jgi:hypothetical protein
MENPMAAEATLMAMVCAEADLGSRVGGMTRTDSPSGKPSAMTDRCEECESILRQMQEVDSLFKEHESAGETITHITDFGLRLEAVEKREHRREELVELREEAMLRQIEHLQSKHHT